MIHQNTSNRLGIPTLSDNMMPGLRQIPAATRIYITITHLVHQGLSKLSVHQTTFINVLFVYMSIGMIRDPFSSTSSNWRVSVRLWDVRVMNKRGTALAGWQVCVCVWVGWMCSTVRPVRSIMRLSHATYDSPTCVVAYTVWMEHFITLTSIRAIRCVHDARVYHGNWQR